MPSATWQQFCLGFNVLTGNSSSNEDLGDIYVGGLMQTRYNCISSALWWGLLGNNPMLRHVSKREQLIHWANFPGRWTSAALCTQWHPSAHNRGNYNVYFLNSLWASDVTWRHGSRSTLAQVMACCLTAPSHYLNQCWLMINEVLWHSPDNNFTENTSDFYNWNEFEIYEFDIVVKSSRGQWFKVKSLQIIWRLSTHRWVVTHDK